MRRTGFLFLIALAACGGSDSTVLDGGPDATSDGTVGDVATNDVSASDVSTSDVTTTGDAGADASNPTDGAAADAEGGTVTGTPGRVTCGNTVCNLGQDCCSTPSGDGGFTLTCVNGGTCPNGAIRSCDEAADCLLNQVCCYEEQNGNLSASCHGDCAGGGGTRFQACSSTAECLSGTCAVHACDAGGSVETCVGIPNICP